ESMGLVIRLRRHGGRKKPFFRIVVADSRSPRDGRFVDQIGTYDPAFDPPRVTLKKDTTERWLKAGAKPSETARKRIKQASYTQRSPPDATRCNGANHEGARSVSGATTGEQPGRGRGKGNTGRHCLGARTASSQRRLGPRDRQTRADRQIDPNHP